jgi:GMP synthase-like glutamine amidotransferase
MKPIWIFRHMRGEGPGFFRQVLEQEGLPYRILAIDDGDPVPETLADCSALVFMGGPMSVNDALPWIDQELVLIRAARQRGLPLLGHCLGAQLISKALGGTVTANPVREIGWHPVRPLPCPAARDWLGELSAPLELFHWHGETFSLPGGAHCILASEHCPQQGFVLDRVLGLQCHVEMTVDMVQDWATRWADEIGPPSASVQTAEAMLEGLQPRIQASQALARRLYARWLGPLLNDDDRL